MKKIIFLFLQFVGPFCRRLFLLLIPSKSKVVSSQFVMRTVFNKSGKMTAFFGGMVVSGVASAASFINPAVSGIYTQVGADAGTLFGFAYILLGIVVGGGIVMTLVSRLARKGASGR